MSTLDSIEGLIRWRPMYGGIIAATVGGLLIYRTWSLVFALTFFGLVTGARQEERALAAEFGQQVPGWIPHFWKRER